MRQRAGLGIDRRYVVRVLYDQQRLTVGRCGPECRFACPLPLPYGDWIWCIHCGEPRATGRDGVECIRLQPRATIDGSFTTTSLALDVVRLPSEEFGAPGGLSI